jgi:hypothetical protein
MRSPAALPLEDAELAMDADIERPLDALRGVHGTDYEGDPAGGADHVKGAIAVAHRILAGETVSLHSSQIEAHLREIASTIRKQTLADKGKVLQALRKCPGKSS